MSLSPIPPLSTIIERLPFIFPEGTEDRNYCIREMSAKTIFVMFYLDALEGKERYMRPSQVTSMSDDQAQRQTDAERLEYAFRTTTRKRAERLTPPPDRWYSENTREPIRDEGLGDGLQKYRAVKAITVPVTSDRPRYYLDAQFAHLFLVSEEGFPAAAKAWQDQNLSADALRRIRLLRAGALARDGAITVTFPNGAGSFQMGPGESSVLTRAFVEEFAPRFLVNPVVLFISESGNKLDGYLNQRLQVLGFQLDTATLLPDAMLLDEGSNPMRVVFAEIVHSDGPIRQERMDAFVQLAASAGFSEEACSFVTVFSNRDSSQFKKAVSHIAWGSFAWFMNEPDRLVVMSKAALKLGEHTDS